LAENCFPEEVDNNCKTVCPPDEKDAKKPENRKDVERKPEMRKEDAQQTNCRPKRCHKRNRKANSKVNMFSTIYLFLLTIKSNLVSKFQVSSYCII